MSVQRTLAQSGPVPTDEALMRQTQRDDLAAFGALYDRHCDAAFGLAHAICGDSAAAENALCDGFRAAWKLRARYDPGRVPVRSWLLALVGERAIESAVRPEPGPPSENGAKDGRDTRPVSPPEDQDRARRLQARLNELEPLQREVIALAYVGGLSHAEIAEHLHMSSTTVKDKMRQGLCTLRSECAPSPAPASPTPARRASLQQPRDATRRRSAPTERGGR